MLRRLFFILVAITVALWSMAEVTKLPIPKSNYKTFVQPVTDAPKIATPTAEQKERIKEYKKELNAKKVELITLADGETYLLAYKKDGQMAMCNSSGKTFGLPYAESPWATELRLVKIKGDDKNYYIEGRAYAFNGNDMEEITYIKSLDGVLITSYYNILEAMEIDGNIYFHASNTQLNNYTISQAHPYRSNFSDTGFAPFVYVPASTDTIATDVVEGVSITLPTIPHPAYFSTEGSRLYLDGSKPVFMHHSSHPFELPNSGYYVTTYNDYDLTVSSTTAIVDGEEKTGSIVSVNPPNTETFMFMSLYAPDGRPLLSDCQSIAFSEPDQMIYYKKADQVKRFLTGAISMADTTLCLPPKFANVQRVVNSEGNGVWLVSRKAFAPLEIYDPDADYTPSYRNNMERHYNDGYYSLAVDELQSPSEPLSYEDLLLGLSAYRIYITEVMPHVEEIVAKYRTGVEPEGMADEHSPNSLKLWTLKYHSSIPKFDEYCRRVVDEAPASDKEIAQRIASEAQDTYKKAHKLLDKDLADARRDYEDMMTQRRIDQARAEALAAQRAQEAAIRKAELQQQRQQAIALAFFNGLSTILQSTVASPARSSGRGGAVTSSGQGASMPVSSGTSGSTGKVDNSSRKAFLKGQIIEWKNKAKKAEASYQQALSSGDDSWQKKKVIDSKRRSVDEALEMVRQFEAELNSLK